ncbi:hypothetical protein PV755_18925 [Streptomyces caniscabiei]|uniref:Uncharacterized protein n=1 Tax=Streptomyces caniscabiei TaxID=2746961 RepID=A0A927L1A2_9ACTN|nr:hypothetical protein [Streptomyces caniscabiei]MBD9723514.1 hypothetical protein [Streptomyces caniscabiei]MDX3510998.1 hypothetical protein [Streptomyces caniscabiei]MDX3721078.1 hypothetical protein [Streptomyces caniscabiei]WEO27085.1 hypothetical protein IHE65_30160 [Streptomyces caniscabiei]
MDLTGGMRVAATAGGVLLTSGLALSGHGFVHDHTTCSIVGMGLIVTALTVIALTVIRVWIGDAREERRELTLARKEADAEQRKYFAAQAALESEMTRLHRDVAAERAAAEAALAVERAALYAELEEERLEITKDAFRTGVEMERSGMLKAGAPAALANLIQFPDQAARELARSREHNGVAP